LTGNRLFSTKVQRLVRRSSDERRTSLCLQTQVPRQAIANTVFFRALTFPLRDTILGTQRPDNRAPDKRNWWDWKDILARFFVNIGYADTLGSGVRNLIKYTKLYSGGEPELIEGDIFKTVIPLVAASEKQAKNKQITQVKKNARSSPILKSMVRLPLPTLPIFSN
jgi:hypothetical protein